MAQIAQPLVPEWMQRRQDNSGPALPRSSSNNSGRGRAIKNSTADRITDQKKNINTVKILGLKDKSPNRDDLSVSSGGKSPRGGSVAASSRKKPPSQFGTLDSNDTDSWIHCAGRSSTGGSVSGIPVGGTASGSIVLHEGQPASMEIGLVQSGP